ncbi:MAG: amino acid adenylation domain-containing protein, partial [Chloroflexota bacterium]
MSNISDRISKLSPEQRAALLKKMRKQEEADASQKQPLQRQPRDTNQFPLSFAQQRLWFLEQLQPGTAVYNIPMAMLLQGALDVTLFEQSFRSIIQRHEILRTTFAVRDNQPVQVISPTIDFVLPVIDLSSLDEATKESVSQHLIHTEVQRPFCLKTGPLLRATLLRLEAETHALLFTQHHIVTDGWSQGLLAVEVFAFWLYLAFDMPADLDPLPIQYADYAVWQRQWLESSALQSHIRYWRRQLDNLSVLQLPTDYPRPPVQTFEGDVIHFQLDREFTEQLRSLSQQTNGTLFMTLLAGWQALLARYSQQDDIAVGMGIAGRTQKETERLIGFFVNTLIMRTDLAGSPTSHDIIRRVQQVTMEAFTHQDIPFEFLVEQLQPDRDLSRHPLVQVMIVLMNAPPATTNMPELSLVALDTGGTKTSKFDLTMSLTERTDSVDGTLEYATNLFERVTIERLLGHFKVLLTAFTTHPYTVLAKLPLLTPEERQQLLVDWNTTELPLNISSIHTVFDQQLAQNPHAIAVVDAQQQHLSYAALSQCADHVAQILQTMGVRSDVPVAMYLDRSPELIIAMLGVVKSGGAYIPIDPNIPTERLMFLLHDTSAPVLLTKQSLYRESLTFDVKPLYLDDLFFQRTSASTLQSPSITPEQLAYVIYTSGSTGTPKGVGVSHANLLNLIAWHQRAYQVSAQDRATLVAGLGFDATVWEVWPYLLAGARVALPDETSRFNSDTLLDWLAAEQSTITFLPTPLAEAALSQQKWPTDLVLRSMLVGGDQLHHWPDSATPFEVINNYGPTENTVVTTWTPLNGYFSQMTLPPIGRPVDNVEVYILDRIGQPTSIGIPGELYVGGSSLSRGYWQRPDVTAAAFVPDSLSGKVGARLYRTGDLVRYRTDGQIEFLGRADHQIKLRGYRIELGEIEAALQQHPALQETVVALREDGPNGAWLIGYVVPHSHSDAPSIANIRTFLSAHLPEYMIPAAIVTMEHIPLTPNGKPDRNALPAPRVADIGVSTEYIAPRTELETDLAEIWQDILSVPQVGIMDDFFVLGGHSLLATQVVNSIRQKWNIELSVRVLFEQPTIAGLAPLIEHAQQLSSDILPPLIPISRTEPLPLSFAQQRLWFIAQLELGTAAYHTFVGLDIRGTLNHAALTTSLDMLVQRHESLRTTFTVDNGQPWQIVQSAMPVSIPVIDLTGLSEDQRDELTYVLGRIEYQRPFDLHQGPVLRATLLRLSDKQHALLLNQHHIVTDGWSIGILVHELTLLYNSTIQGIPASLTPLPIQYGDFAVWQRTWLQREVLERQLNYWRQQLADLETLQLPTDYVRPAMPTYRGANAFTLFEEQLIDQAHVLSRQAGTSLFMTLLAVWKILLSRYSGQDDIVVGAPIAGRTHAELEHLIGFFVNTLVLRTHLDKNPSGWELLKRIQTVTLGAYAHQDIPFEHLVAQLQPERDLSRQPLFQVSFILQNAPMSSLELPDVTIEFLNMNTMTTQFDMVFHLHEIPQGVYGRLEYATDIFEDVTIERLLGHYRMLLSGLIADSASRVHDLPLLTPAELHQLCVTWNQTQQLVLADTFIALFTQKAQHTPDKVAVVFADQSLSYAALDRQSNQIAYYLMSHGVATDVCVAVCVERSLELPGIILGVLKAGGVYVPLDPDYPADRLSFILQDTKASVFITQTTLDTTWASSEQSIMLDADWTAIEAMSPDACVAPIHPQQAAYMIYTSGSTGTPKGVLVPHCGLANVIGAQQHELGITTADRVLQFASLNFDASMFELVMALGVGSTLYLGTRMALLPGPDLAHFLAQHAITTATLTPSSLAMLPATFLPHLRTLLVAGESCSLELASRWGTARQFFNLYGPTEGTIWTTALAFDSQATSMTIGKPIANTSVYIVDQTLQPVPIGVPGELCIGGVGVAHGYHARPGLTAARFIPNPFSDTSGRLYRTGDLVRYHHNGQIEFLGRIDQQVKVRGYRIELGEIEAVLEEHPSVHTSILLAREDIPGDKRLTAYVVPETAPLHNGADTNGHTNSAHVANWQTLYDETYHQAAQASVDDATFNITGWESSYTRTPIPAEEMHEWVTTTVERIARHRPKQILELGCGSGLLLFRLAEQCERYVATDFAAGALTYIHENLNPNWDHVELYQQTADDFSGLVNQQFDMIVLNSVVQYFPNITYLLHVLESALKVLAPGGQIFIGDVRSLPLLDVFMSAVQLYQASPNTGRTALWQRVQQMVATERELVIAPQFFYDLSARFPVISNAQVEVKRGWSHNELTQFRYDVTLTVSGPTPVMVPEVAHDWQAEMWTLERVRTVLVEKQASWLVLNGIPSARLIEAVCSSTLLVDSAGPATAHGIRAEIDRRQLISVEPEALWQLGEELGYQVFVTWSQFGGSECYDVVFAQSTADSSSLQIHQRQHFVDPPDWDVYANRPVWDFTQRELGAQLRIHLLEQIPDYMVPSAFVVLSHIPMTPNGKVDRAALPAPEQIYAWEQQYVAPSTPLEEQLVLIWHDVFGVAQIGITDDLFALGG